MRSGTRYGVSSWPTARADRPAKGTSLAVRGGEFKAEDVRRSARTRRSAVLPRREAARRDAAHAFDLEAASEEATPLRFPGKVLADEPGNRLFISDSNHNRIVIATLDGKLLDMIGSGADRPRRTATSRPRRSIIRRAVPCMATRSTSPTPRTTCCARSNLKTKTVDDDRRHRRAGRACLAGPRAGRAAPAACPSGGSARPQATALNSPWALWVHKNDLYIAMAGPHQIWKMPLDESEIGPYAGNGREDIVDGPLLPQKPVYAGLFVVRPAQRPVVRRHVALRRRQRRQLDPRRAVRSAQAA